MKKIKLNLQISKEIIKLIIISILLITTVAGTWLLYKGFNDSTRGKYQDLNSSDTNLLDYCREFNKCGFNATCTLNEASKNYSCYTHDSLISQNASFTFNKTHLTEGNFLMFTCSSMLESIEDSWTLKVPTLSVNNITIMTPTCPSSSLKNSPYDYSVDYLNRNIFFICPNDGDYEDDKDDDDDDDDSEDEDNSYVLKTMSYNGTVKNIYMENLIDNEITDPTFAIDWISRNIFWVNHTLNAIFVASLNNSSMKVELINNISNAKYICVHPGRGKIYWLNNCGKSCQIETANEDGSNRSIFLSGFEIQQATSLIIDITSDKLCWIGGKNIPQFKCADIEKKNITIIANVNSLSRIAVSDDTYYWTMNRHQIYYIDKKKSSKPCLLIDTRKNKSFRIREPIIHNLVFISENIPSVTNLCQRKKCGCNFDELCLPKEQHDVTCRKA